MCKKLGAYTDKRTLKEAHRVKMELKNKLRQDRYENQQPVEHIFANISKHHEFYGDTVAQHNNRKLENNS